MGASRRGPGSSDRLSQDSATATAAPSRPPTRRGSALRGVGGDGGHDVIYDSSMRALPDDPRLDAVRARAAGTDGLRLLLLFGSRAIGEAHAQSDWDFAFLGDSNLDVAMLQAGLTLDLGTDDVDLVDLDRAGALLRYNAADTGACVHEATPGIHEEFWLEAVHFWCDAGPIIRREYDAILTALP